MSHIRFKAPEYQADGSFVETQYEYEGDEQSGWVIRRNDEEFDRLGPGYTPVDSLYCGVCSTDLARRFLPYPLPQIIGHEVVGMKDGKPVVVEINASHLARGIADQDDPYNSTMHTHDPRRITLGIDRLPGGFAPVLLAPVDAVIPVPDNVHPLVASLTEPFAAALQGVEATHPRPGDRVAVLGPRRLGSLIIAALAGFRKKTGIDFEIIGVARHDHLLELCKELGADTVVNNAKVSAEELNGAFDIVFDTTGKPPGFAAALAMTRRVLHLKSTNGQEVMGLAHLTDMVVDEIALLPYTTGNLDYTWPTEQDPRRNLNVYVAPGVGDDVVNEASTASQESGRERNFHRLEVSEAEAKIGSAVEESERKHVWKTEYPPASPFPRFDLALASNLGEVDRIVRPTPGKEFSILRARGAVLLTKPANGSYDSELHRAVVERGIEIHTSRCGDFVRALDILKDNPQITAALEKHLITHRFPLGEIEAAFTTAADSEKSVKVIVETGKK